MTPCQSSLRHHKIKGLRDSVAPFFLAGSVHLFTGDSQIEGNPLLSPAFLERNGVVKDGKM
jgi:hypothetical protein